MTITAYLYRAGGHDRETALGPAMLAALGEDDLLWIDVEQCDDSAASDLAELLAVDAALLKRLCGTGAAHHLDNFGDHYAFAVETAIPDQSGKDGEHAEKGPRLGFVVGQRWLLTIRREPVDFLEAFRDQDKGETRIGALSPSLLVASLLDWHLSEFLHTVSIIESDADRLDEKILAEGTHSNALGQVVEIRRRVSRLRVMIARQRPVFHGLSRPDFALNADESAAAHFRTLATRFDRVVDEVERSRDVARGSFDLFTSMTTQQTNELVKALTFLTALIGACAAVAGLLGMNFKMPFFDTGVAGFVGVTAGLAFVGVIAIIWARYRRWI